MSDQPVAENRLVQVNFLNPQPTTKPDNVQMAYDGEGRRVSITELHGTTAITAKTFVWCGKDLCQQRDVTGHTVSSQFFTLGEQINGTNYYYSKDHLGNVREMTDNNGVVHANYDYDSYGRQTKLSGDLDSDFGYTGFYIERTLCLDLTWYRAYDPEKGRWLSRDPLEEFTGHNLYDYVWNNPFRYLDALGLLGTPQQVVYVWELVLVPVATVVTKIITVVEDLTEFERIQNVINENKKITDEYTGECGNKYTEERDEMLSQTNSYLIAVQKQLVKQISETYTEIIWKRIWEWVPVEQPPISSDQ